MIIINSEQRENFFNEMHKLYNDIRKETYIINKYDRKNYFENYKDLCMSCASLIRNHRLDLLYLWHQDENTEEYYAIPVKQEELNNNGSRVLDISKVKNSITQYGDIYPTIYVFAFIIVRCLILIRDVNAIKPLEQYKQTPKKGVDSALIMLHNQIIIPEFNRILVEEGEEGVSKIDIDAPLNAIINVALLAAANAPSFRWRTTDAAFIKAMLLNEKPIRELVAE